MKPCRLWLYSLVCRALPETRFFGLKVTLLRWCGAKIGSNVRVNSTAVFAGTGELEIGDDVWIGSGCRISPVGGVAVRIGSCCDLGPEVMILTGSHEIDTAGLHIGGKGTASSVTIGNGCWLGARALILPGVSLAEKTLVAAGAVVVKGTDTPKTMLAGVPAKCCKQY